jgi:hypothetical protein
MPLAGEIVDPEEAERMYPAEHFQVTSEGKPDDYRWLSGQIVVVDYGLVGEIAARERRAYYCKLLGAH